NEEFFALIEGLGFKTFIKKLRDQFSVQKQVQAVVEVACEVKKIHKIVTTEAELLSFLEQLRSEEKVAVCSSLTEEDVANVAVTTKSGEVSTFSSQARARTFFEELWAQEKLEIITIDAKRELALLKRRGAKIAAHYFDIGVAHYLCDVANKHTLEFVAASYLQKELPVDAGLEVRVSVLWALYEIFREKLQELKLEKIFYEVDNPLLEVLAEMENTGIALDCDCLKQLQLEFSRELLQIEARIIEITGEEINLKSPKQVGVLLFEKMGLPVIRKTKTMYSTDSDVLEQLAQMGFNDEVPASILRHRELDKLVSTYVKVLPELINPKTNRLHTSFNSTVTATGRLSSDNPNLQNIPIRGSDGKRIRQAFVASKGHLLLSADYSQIELRLLAHFAEDDLMIAAFMKGRDIHAETAAEVLGMEIESVRDKDRSLAKAVNFGLMYGQSSFGLSQLLKIPQWEAKRYITKYFERFQKVKIYIDALKELCAKKGYAETMFGRKRFLPDIHSQNRTVRSFAERMAINTPIQGSAADIIKLAMINIERELFARKLPAKLLLQVHDELIFEVPLGTLDELCELVTCKMEGVVSLRVPLKVSVGSGVDWLALEA
ncbi:MAG: DNA polymerase I, partial [Oligoflexia bacterium]|nr:DNA polymerase I [Oligoflexia bacterium]